MACDREQWALLLRPQDRLLPSPGMPLSDAYLVSTGATLHNADYTFSDLVATVLARAPNLSPSTRSHLNIDAIAILEVLSGHTATQEATREWARKAYLDTCKREMVALSHPDVGLHFQANSADQKSLESFDSTLLVETYQRVAPTVWGTICALLDADSERLSKRRKKYKRYKSRRKRDLRKAESEAATATGQPGTASEDGGTDQTRMEVDASSPPEHQSEMLRTDDTPLLWEDEDGNDELPASEPPRSQGRRLRTSLPADVSAGDTEGADDDDEYWLHYDPLPVEMDDEGDEDANEDEDNEEEAREWMEKIASLVSICNTFTLMSRLN